MQCNSAGDVALKLKTPSRDGTTHVVMSPLEFIQPLAAPAPRAPAHPQMLLHAQLISL